VRIEAGGWPDDPGGQGPAVVALQNWWGIEPLNPVAAVEVPAGFTASSRFQPIPVSIGGDAAVVVESIRLEEHSVGDTLGPRRRLPCLVIRLRYPAGNPHWVALEGLEGIEAKDCEHRFYPDADRYTGIFWSVGEDEAGKKLRALKLYSLENFKESARRQGRYVTARLWKP
jgi:hypothetical protein